MEWALTIIFMLATVVYIASMVALSRTHGEARWARTAFSVSNALVIAAMAALNWLKGRHWLNAVLAAGLLCVAALATGEWRRRGSRPQG